MELKLEWGDVATPVGSPKLNEWSYRLTQVRNLILFLGQWLEILRIHAHTHTNTHTHAS